MSSFLCEKKQIKCACFESSTQNVRRIFRSQSQYSASNGPKSINDTSVKFETPKTKLNKKSLKKYKPFEPSVSQNCLAKSDQVIQQIFVPLIQIKNARKQQKIPQFELQWTGKHQGVKTQRSKAAQNLKVVNFPLSYASEQFVIPTVPKSHNYLYSHHLITPVYNEQYDKLVQQEFKKDIEQFTKRMDVKDLQRNSQQRKGTKTQQNLTKQKELTSILRIPQNNQKQQNLERNNIQSKQIYDSQKFCSNKKDTKKELLSGKKHLLDRMDSLQSIPEQNLLQKSLHDITLFPARRQRKKSFRNSTILHKEKQMQDKKLKHKMYAKEIESQKDGNSEESDKISEVVGRGWDGLTEQKQRLQELDEMMIQKQGNHSQTMITQQSHIKNSEIKTFTDYSNSFISPKSQRTGAMQTSVAFGGGKYGIAGISYQHIDDLQKLKNSAYGKLHF